MFDYLFNLHDILLIMTAALSLLLATPMLLQRNKQRVDVVLAVFVLVQGSVALYYLLLYSATFRPYTVALIVPFQVVPIAFLFAMQGLLLFWYSNLMATGESIVKKSDFLLILVLVSMPALLKAIGGQVIDEGTKEDGIYLTLPALIVSVSYGLRALLVVLRHEQNIRENYSNLENTNLVWLGFIALGFVAVWCIRLAGYFSGMSARQDWEPALAISSNVPPLLLVAAMVILGLSQRKPAAVRRQETKLQVGQGLPVNLGSKANPLLLKKLETLMVDVNVYQDPDLDREGLADSMGISARSLSSLINGHYKQTFYEYVNSYRIDAAKSALLDPENEDLSVQRIFEDAGFNSKSTFNTLLKKATGMTPTEYRKGQFDGLSAST